MIELIEDEQGNVRRGWGGDTLNTAVYMARSLDRSSFEVAYLTALGDDPFSQQMVDGWQAEGVDTQAVLRLPGKLPGLYAIRTDARGDRSFYYWREQAAVRALFTHEEGAHARRVLREAAMVYLSGITLAILPPASREMLIDNLAQARGRGARVAFDPNYRARLWPTKEEARGWQKKLLSVVDIALPTHEDEHHLWGDVTAEATGARLLEAGLDHIVVKNGEAPTLVATHEGMHTIPLERVVTPIDTTGAGDSFNAAYLSGLLRDATPTAAVRAGQRLAAQVVQHRGAIMPREAHPDPGP
ncbi:MAG: sugar kinase [Geminicoccaceae bacterium]|nr:sugar kinase [Geminicoccaceae bacterium]